MKTQKKKLFWVYTAWHEEDWFIIADTKQAARKFHEEYEGFNYGDAKASLIQTVEKNYERKKVYHAQLPMLIDLGFTVLSESPFRTVIKDGKVYQEGTYGKFNLLVNSINKEGIYLIHAVGTDFYKIGVTKDLITRLRNIQTGSPLPIELFGFWHSKRSSVVESIIHSRYKQFCIGKEWFKFSSYELSSVIADINKLKNQSIWNLVSIRDGKNYYNKINHVQ